MATLPNYGLVAYWPLNDIEDVTTNAVTDDIWGGWNGFYGTNALNGLNSILLGGPISGPGSTATSLYTGFPPDDSALGANNTGINGYVKTVASPTMANTTNMTIVEWINATNATMPANVGLLIQRANGQTNGLAFGTGDSLEYVWNGVRGAVGSGCQPTYNNWCMVAMVVTASNTTFYAATTNGVSPFPFAVSNAYQSWGGSLAIGGDPGADSADTFQGYIADVAIFSNALSAAQIDNLYYGGVASGAVPPVISVEPVSTELWGGRPAEFSVGYSGFGVVTNQWQIFSGGVWVNVPNTLAYSGQTTPTLRIANSSSGAGSYRVVVGEQGTALKVTSITVTLSAPPAQAAVNYPTAVSNLSPVVYYRFNEPQGSLVAYDYFGGLTATYGGYYSGTTWEVGAEAGVPGVNYWQGLGAPVQFTAPGAANDFEKNNTGVLFTNDVVFPTTGAYSYLTVPPLTTISNGIITNNMTITMWIYPNEAQLYANGLLYCREGGTVAGIGFASSAFPALGYNWGNTAGTINWTGNQSLVPAPGAWNFVALVITPTNGTLYCYNVAAQNSALNNTPNAAQAWSGAAEIGNDPFDATGARQFDGSIDEVAIFNYALSSTQVNALWTSASGLQVPAVIQVAPSGPTNFANIDTALTFTTVAANGPFSWQWLITNAATFKAVVLTNGNNGYTGSLFSGATSGSLTISNMPLALAGQSLMVSVSNFVVNMPATAVVTLPQLFPTGAIWTADYYATNAAGGGTGNQFTVFGPIGAGNIWNAFANAGPYMNVSSSNDVGTIANTGTEITVFATGGASDSAIVTSDYLLMDVFFPISTGTGITITTQPGFYNLFMYSCESTWANRGCTFVIDTNSQSCVNVTGTQGGGNYGSASERVSYVLGENMAIFTNVFVPSGTLNIGTGPSQSGSTANFNGMQLQFIEPFAPLTFTAPSKANVQLSWAGGVLQAAGTVDGQLYERDELWLHGLVSIHRPAPAEQFGGILQGDGDEPECPGHSVHLLMRSL